MKKMIAGALVCSTVMLTACGSNASDVSNSSLESQESAVTAESTAIWESLETADANSEAAGDSVKVEPLAAAIDVANLADGTYSVSFETADAAEEDGTLTFHLTVYDYEHFDADQIKALKEGDVLSIDGSDVTVESVSVSDTGLVSINGGLEEGGHDLFVDEDGTYYESLMDIGKMYNPVGEVTLPVSEDFLFTDDCDPENQGQEYSAATMLNLLNSSDMSYSFTSDNTSITVADGKITSMHRIFMP